MKPGADGLIDPCPGRYGRWRACILWGWLRVEIDGNALRTEFADVVGWKAPDAATSAGGTAGHADEGWIIARDCRRFAVHRSCRWSRGGDRVADFFREWHLALARDLEEFR